MNKISKRLGTFGLALLILGGLIYGFLPQPRMVDAGLVSQGPMNVVVLEEGRTRVIDRYIISAPVPGVACRMDLNVGDNVEQGQVLLGLEPLQSEVLDPRRREEAKAGAAAARSALRAAEANSRAAQAEVDYASSELQRIKKLFDSGHVSRGVIDKAQAEARRTDAALQSAKFVVEVARYELEAAQTALKYSAAQEVDSDETVPIRVPVTGQILKIHHECNGVVTRGQPILEIGDTRRLEVEIDVLSADAVSFVPGMRIVFKHWGKNRPPLEGRVRTVEPAGFTKISALGVEEQRVLVIADIVSPYEQWSRLGDGYRVEAEFILWEQDKVLQVAESALFRYQDAWAVFVLQGGQVYRRQVQIGQQNGLKAEVISGLKIDDRVILYPDDTIIEGGRVKVRTYE